MCMTTKLSPYPGLDDGPSVQIADINGLMSFDFIKA